MNNIPYFHTAIIDKDGWLMLPKKEPGFQQQKCLYAVNKNVGSLNDGDGCNLNCAHFIVAKFQDSNESKFSIRLCHGKIIAVSNIKSEFNNADHPIVEDVINNIFKDDDWLEAVREAAQESISSIAEMYRLRNTSCYDCATPITDADILDIEAPAIKCDSCRASICPKCTSTHVCGH